MLPKNGRDLLDSLALQVVPISAGWANQPMSSAVNDGYLQTGADAVRQPEQSKGFGRLKRRWGVPIFREWNWNRRLTKDYERLPETAQTVIYTAMIRLILRRIT